ncbi:MAG: hemolysin III family protein [Microthrixaceae bacterium]
MSFDNDQISPHQVDGTPNDSLATVEQASVAARVDAATVLETVDAYGHRPLMRGWLHFAAFLVVLPAGLYLLTTADTAAARVAVAVYWASLAGLFATSASYHRLAHSPKAVLWMRRADHSMIFTLIAGTYTPICLVVLPAIWGIPMLVVIWVTALAGIIMKMVRLGTGGGKSGSWLYIAMGWAAIVTMPVLLTRLTALQTALLAIGGLLYTVGAIILGTRKPDPFPSRFGYHEVWHALTIAAGACHFVLIATVVS